MASSRPNYIDLSSNKRFDSSQIQNPSSRDLPSPRSGEVPPALSPLDAFAFQGRILARQFQQNSDDGRRISRLPPLTVGHELARPRPNYFTPSPLTVPEEEFSNSDNPQNPQESPLNRETTQPEWRPKSYYPFIQTFDDASSILSRDSTMSNATTMGYHEIPGVPGNEPPKDQSRQLDHTRSASPDSLRGDVRQRRAEYSNKLGIPPARYHQTQKKSLGLDSMRSGSPLGLTPPRSPGMHSLRNQPSIRSVRVDSGDDSDTNSFLSEPHDRERKLSTSSHLSRPLSPFSLVSGPPRSPSAVSEVSDGRQNIPRGSINFSRPISRTGRPSGELSRPSLDFTRQTSMDSPQLRPSTDVLSLSDSINSPVLHSPPSKEYFAHKASELESNTNFDQSNPAPSYIYAKYSLPRGRILPRDLPISSNQSDQTHKFEWDQPFEGTNVTRFKIGEPDQVDSVLGRVQDSQHDRTSKTTLTALDLTMGSLNLAPPVRTRSADDSSPAGRSARTHQSSPSFPPPTLALQSSLASTSLRPSTSHNPQLPRADSGGTAADDFTIEDHLSKGIACHEQGELQKSTYHLRIAARGGSATAMLLYALACRHGWGMRRNQAEGVEWLRKAVDSAGLEVASDEASLALERSSVATDAKGKVKSSQVEKAQASSAIERKSHKAQLALSIFELGVSYINGWGIAEDKALGVRCFEIAGGWGDADALAEAGFCYAKGVGCKKDLHKAAEFYRRAEAGGISMAGNSWIYKEKYMPKKSLEERRSRADDKDRSKDKEKKVRDKSRTRTIFGARKKSIAESNVS